MDKNIEDLMMNSGFTLREIEKIKFVAEKSGHSVLKEINELSDSFYRVVFIVFFSLFVSVFIFLVPEKANVIGFLFSIFCVIPFALFMVAARLRYKAFIFMKKYKGDSF
ncbi:hypothetical protein Xbed_02631 [Xenorhabdus beddingii]|uniref:Uncharacterized protein n=1 Tax=Xenorhabdus beddingii TaxID=40578 RepID=A0A1Y2SM91_9GAMM|nr:hypothetical protein [Xenorhabdus beddingii]OTA19234.1 hypothetical protein Xbed_02631 [Xenorhabdus beddingii]